MRYYLNRTGNAEGPFEDAAIIEMIRSGQVPPTANVAAEGQSQWQPIGSHPAFAPAFGSAAPAAQAPAAMAAATGPAQAANKGKSRVPLLVGLGCGGLLLVVALGAGAYFLLGAGGSDFTDEMLATAADVKAAARGESFRDAWTAPRSGGWHNLGATEEEDQARARSLGDAEVVVVSVGLEAVALDGRRVRAGAWVFPDGKLRWSDLRVDHTDVPNPQTDITLNRDLSESERRALSGVDELLAGLDSDCESLTLLTAGDLSDMPPQMAANIPDFGPARSAACAQVESRHGFPVHRLSDIQVMLRSGSSYLSLRSGFQEAGTGEIYLDPIHVQAL